MRLRLRSPLTAGCVMYRCYVVPGRTEQVAPQLVGVLRSIGALNAETRRLPTRVGAYPGVIAHNVIVVFLGPYFACHPGPCRRTDESKVDITFPSGAPQS